jgi:hypothetical protein
MAGGIAAQAIAALEALDFAAAGASFSFFASWPRDGVGPV